MCTPEGTSTSLNPAALRDLPATEPPPAEPTPEPEPPARVIPSELQGLPADWPIDGLIAAVASQKRAAALVAKLDSVAVEAAAAAARALGDGDIETALQAQTAATAAAALRDQCPAPAIDPRAAADALSAARHAISTLTLRPGVLELLYSAERELFLAQPPAYRGTVEPPVAFPADLELVRARERLEPELKAYISGVRSWPQANMDVTAQLRMAAGLLTEGERLIAECDELRERTEKQNNERAASGMVWRSVHNDVLRIRQWRVDGIPMVEFDVLNTGNPGTLVHR